MSIPIEDHQRDAIKALHEEGFEWAALLGIARIVRISGRPTLDGLIHDFVTATEDVGLAQINEWIGEVASDRNAGPMARPIPSPVRPQPSQPPQSPPLQPLPRPPLQIADEPPSTSTSRQREKEPAPGLSFVDMSRPLGRTFPVKSCPVKRCEFTFAREGRFARHFVMTHGILGETKYCCGEEFPYQQLEAYALHLVKWHINVPQDNAFLEKEGPYLLPSGFFKQCPVQECGYRTRSMQNFMSHFRAHHSDLVGGPQFCCGRDVFSMTPSAYAEHLWIEHMIVEGPVAPNDSGSSIVTNPPMVFPGHQPLLQPTQYPTADVFFQHQLWQPHLHPRDSSMTQFPAGPSNYTQIRTPETYLLEQPSNFPPPSGFAEFPTQPLNFPESSSSAASGMELDAPHDIDDDIELDE